MKILIVHNIYQQAGGEQAAVEAQVNLLRAKGHEIIQYQRDNHEIDKYKLQSKIGFFPQTIYSARTMHEVEELIHDKKPDIAHIHNVFPLISPSIYHVLHKKGIPIVQTIHNFRFMCPNGLFYTHKHICELCKFGNTVHAIPLRCYHNNFILSALYSLTIGLHRHLKTFDQISNFVALTPFSVNKLVECGITAANKICLIPNFLPDPLPQPGAMKRKNEAIFIGRLSEEKGVHVLLEALRLIPNLKLRILGTGPQESELRRLAGDMEGRVSFEGYVTGIQKMQFLRNAQMMVIPSTCYEQFPISALESMAVATPLIVSNLGGLASIVENGQNGLLFKSGNAEDLSLRIQEIIQNPGRAYEIGLEGKRRIESKFNSEVHYQSLINLYKNLPIAVN